MKGESRNFVSTLTERLTLRNTNQDKELDMEAIARKEVLANLERTAEGINQILKNGFLFKDAAESEEHACMMRQRLQMARGVIAKLFDAQEPEE